MTFYQELQLNQAGSKNLLKKSETLKEKLYHMWVYLVKIAATMAFCFFFVSIFSILFGNENSIVGVVVLLCLMVFRNADLGIHTGQSTMLLALFFVIMTVCPHLANQFSPVLGMLLNKQIGEHVDECRGRSHCRQCLFSRKMPHNNDIHRIEHQL